MKKFLSAFLVLVFALSATAVVYANDLGIELMNNNVGTADTLFSISSSGKATVSNKYSGSSGITKKAEIVTKVQKKVGIVWVTVSGASWTDTSTSVNFSKSHSVQLSSNGTYRAHSKFTISGSGGSDDKITRNVEKTYK